MMLPRTQITENPGTANSGTIARVSGPIVRARNLAEAMIYQVVEVSERRLTGEVIRLEGDLGTTQVYEDTTGVRPGQPVFPTAAPLSLWLGPGLIANMYDGIQRPLREIAEFTGCCIKRGEKVPPLPPASCASTPSSADRSPPSCTLRALRRQCVRETTNPKEGHDSTSALLARALTAGTMRMRR